MDFSALSNDQLLELLRAAMLEAIARGNTMETAARNEVLDAKEKAEIAAEVRERHLREKAEQERKDFERTEKARLEREEKEKKLREESEKKEKLWKKQNSIVKAVQECYNGYFEIVFWEKGSEKRIYFQDSFDGRKFKYCFWKSAGKKPTGTLVVEENKAMKVSNDAVKDFLVAIAKNWKSLKMNSDDVTGYTDYDEKHYTEYCIALGIESVPPAEKDTEQEVQNG